MRISDWSSDVCSSDLSVGGRLALSLAGNDALVAGSGNDTIAGDALSLGGDATANNEATVTGGDAPAGAIALAGNDLIVSEVEELLGGGDGEEAGDLVAGDALSAADHGVAKANSTAKVDDTGDTYVNAAIAGSDRKSTRLNSSH